MAMYTESAESVLDTNHRSSLHFSGLGGSGDRPYPSVLGGV
jgi:hypothetical protein